jgi:two-component system, sensor histidine kinase and response regulator
MAAAPILLVDDEEDIRETLRELLEEEGYRVLTAADGREALAILRSAERPRVVLLDIIMPVMSGTELYAAMQAERALADIPVIISTSDPSRAPSGVFIMRKPINLTRLLAVIAGIPA